MDIRASCEESSLELARELLITISYSVPDKILDSSAFENFSNKDEAVTDNTDGADDLSLLRSKLISISNIQSPDFSVTRCNGHP